MTSIVTPRPSLLALSLIGLCGAGRAAPLQLTSGNTNSFAPSLSGDGSRLVFQHFVINGSNANFQTQSFDVNPNTLTPPGVRLLDVANGTTAIFSPAGSGFNRAPRSVRTATAWPSCPPSTRWA